MSRRISRGPINHLGGVDRAAAKQRPITDGEIKLQQILEDRDASVAIVARHQRTASSGTLSRLVSIWERE